MGQFRDLDELAAAVQQDEPLAVTGLDLRDADGAKRLSSGVRERIAERLQDRGLGFFPPYELPDWHEEPVYVYRLGSPLGKLIAAVVKPTDMGLRLLSEAVAPTAKVTKEQDNIQEALDALKDAITLLQQTKADSREQGDEQQERDAV
jgi:hypothetical protein